MKRLLVFGCICACGCLEVGHPTEIGCFVDRTQPICQSNTVDDGGEGGKGDAGGGDEGTGGTGGIGGGSSGD